MLAMALSSLRVQFLKPETGGPYFLGRSFELPPPLHPLLDNNKNSMREGRFHDSKAYNKGQERLAKAERETPEQPLTPRMALEPTGKEIPTAHYQRTGGGT